jgi:two-component system, NarL family, response regulator NreC
MPPAPDGSTVARVRTKVVIAGGPGALRQLRGANGEVELVAHVHSLREAEGVLRVSRPAVLVLDSELCQHEGLCSLPALRRASPGTAIVLPPAGEPGPRLVRAVRLAARDFERRRGDDGLTLRERDLVRLVALGHTNAEIAELLTLSIRTVEKHRARIQQRLEVSGRAELVRWALDRGLVDS